MKKYFENKYLFFESALIHNMRGSEYLLSKKNSKIGNIVFIQTYTKFPQQISNGS